MAQASRKMAVQDDQPQQAANPADEQWDEDEAVRAN